MKSRRNISVMQRARIYVCVFLSVTSWNLNGIEQPSHGAIDRVPLLEGAVPVRYFELFEPKQKHEKNAFTCEHTRTCLYFIGPTKKLYWLKRTRVYASTWYVYVFKTSRILLYSVRIYLVQNFWRVPMIHELFSSEVKDQFLVLEAHWSNINIHGDLRKTDGDVRKIVKFHKDWISSYVSGIFDEFYSNIIY